MSRRSTGEGEEALNVSRCASSRRAMLGGAALLLLGCGAQQSAAHASADHPLLGAPAPALELPTPDGTRRITLAQYSGKVVIVDFWATWCEPCRQSFPAYQRLANEFRGRLVVLGVSVDEEPSRIPAFLSETGASFEVAWDEGQSAVQSYRPSTMPTSFIVDTSGIVRFVHAGYLASDEQQIKQEVQSLL